MTPGLCPQLKVPALCHPMCTILSLAWAPHGCSCRPRLDRGVFLSPQSRAGQSHVPTITRSTLPSAPAMVPTMSLCPHGLHEQCELPSWPHFEPHFHPPFISCCLLDASCPLPHAPMSRTGPLEMAHAPSQ